MQARSSRPRENRFPSFREEPLPVPGESVPSTDTPRPHRAIPSRGSAHSRCYLRRWTGVGGPARRNGVWAYGWWFSKKQQLMRSGVAEIRRVPGPPIGYHPPSDLPQRHWKYLKYPKMQERCPALVRAGGHSTSPRLELCKDADPRAHEEEHPRAHPVVLRRRSARLRRRHVVLHEQEYFRRYVVPNARRRDGGLIGPRSVPTRAAGPALTKTPETCVIGDGCGVQVHLRSQMWIPLLTPYLEKVSICKGVWGTAELVAGRGLGLSGSREPGERSPCVASHRRAARFRRARAAWRESSRPAWHQP